MKWHDVPLNAETEPMNTYDHLLRASLAAANGSRGVLSTGEHLAAAIVLNRSDWLGELGFSIPEALTRLGEDWVSAIPRVALAVTEELAKQAQAAGIASNAMKVAAAFTSSDENAPSRSDPVDFDAMLITYGHAPGYRDIDLFLELRRRDTPATLNARIRLMPADSVEIMRHIIEVNESAWRNGEPIDATEGELRPQWL